MNRRSISAVAASVVAAAVLLSACGGGGGEKGDSKKADAPPAKGSAKGSPAPAAPASGPKRPEIGLSGEHRVTFDFVRPEDPRQGAALADTSRFVQAIWHGVEAQDANDPAYRFYSRAGATAFGKGRIEQELKGGWVTSGTNRYYNATTAPGQDAQSVRVTFCHDRSKSVSKVKKTGKLRPAPQANADNFALYTVLLRPSPALPQGWVAQQVEVKERATAECRTTKPAKLPKAKNTKKPSAGQNKHTPPKKSGSGSSGSKSKPSKPKTRH
ncbi:hypothetical protein ACIO3O_32565 [Streptomyces sp. NPDC087440]|uniref:hypothetical protein n=1 Tax=Streptomyces sp. NPDC087440 TaxID=3365790 RepID=UPI00382B7452